MRGSAHSPRLPNVIGPTNGIEGRFVDMVGELRVVERADRFNRRFEDLHLGVGVGREVEPERIDAGNCRTLARAIQELLDAGGD